MNIPALNPSVTGKKSKYCDLFMVNENPAHAKPTDPSKMFLTIPDATTVPSHNLLGDPHSPSFLL